MSGKLQGILLNTLVLYTTAVFKQTYICKYKHTPHQFLCFICGAAMQCKIFMTQGFGTPALTPAILIVRSSVL